MMTKDRLRQLTGDERLGQMRESEYGKCASADRAVYAVPDWSHHQADAGTVSCQPAGDQYLRPLRAIPA